MQRRLHVGRVRDVVGQLWERVDEMVEAIVADGWPESMAQAGLGLQRDTWEPDALASSVRAELSALWESPAHRIAWPGRIHHIWPALPGAGVAPVLVGMLLGLDQRVRPSSRGRHFARQFCRIGGLEPIEPDGPWEDADVVVVSGTDETVAEIRHRLSGRVRVVGYGHRVSFAVVDDGPQQVQLGEVADRLAEDVVMWHQRGCFSARAVLFDGNHKRRRQFAKLLAGAIAECEQRWGTDGITDDELAVRAQRLGVAEMTDEVFCDGVGYARLTDQAFDGGREAVHSVTVHPVEGPAGVGQMVEVPRENLQGCALDGAWQHQRDRWLSALGATGVTRLCDAGDLQSPPPNWWHDGSPNALSLGRVVTVG